MRHFKPGRGPSAMGAFGGIIGVLFGIFWTVMAYSMTRNAPEPFATFFPLFGVLFVLVGIVNVAYNLYNATQKKRLSLLDLTSPSEEADPLGEIVDRTGGDDGSVESKLRELNALRDKGLVTDTEYAAQRQRILNSL